MTLDTLSPLLDTLFAPIVSPCGVEPPSNEARRLQRQSPSEDEPRALKREKPPRFPGRLSTENQCKSAPLASQTFDEGLRMRIARLAIAFAIPGPGGDESYAQHDSHTMRHRVRLVNK